jgi:ATP-binding cassette subfamily B (MDR/TAP) protein 1
LLLDICFTSDVNKIQEGIGDKMGAFFQWMATFIAGLIIALVRGWKLALVCLSLSPVIALCGGTMMKVCGNYVQ